MLAVRPRPVRRGAGAAGLRGAPGGCRRRRRGAAVGSGPPQPGEAAAGAGAGAAVGCGPPQVGAGDGGVPAPARRRRSAAGRPRWVRGRRGCRRRRGCGRRLRAAPGGCRRRRGCGRRLRAAPGGCRRHDRIGNGSRSSRLPGHALVAPRDGSVIHVSHQAWRQGCGAPMRAAATPERARRAGADDHPPDAHSVRSGEPPVRVTDASRPPGRPRRDRRRLPPVRPAAQAVPAPRRDRLRRGRRSRSCQSVDSSPRRSCGPSDVCTPRADRAGPHAELSPGARSRPGPPPPPARRQPSAPRPPACPGGRTRASRARSRRGRPVTGSHRTRRRAACPASAATALASASPIRGPPVTTRMWIELTRPRRASGVRSWTIELRSTALMTSAPDAMARNSRASGKLKVASPKPTMPRLQTATAIRTARPGRRTFDVQPLNMAATKAPRPTADAIRPTPAGPTRNTSRARGVNSDRGDPKTIALMSTTRKVARTSRRLRA